MDAGATWLTTQWRRALRPCEAVEPGEPQWVADGARLLRAYADARVVAVVGGRHVIDGDSARRVLVDVACSADGAEEAVPRDWLSVNGSPPLLDAALAVLVRWWESLECAGCCAATTCSRTLAMRWCVELPALVRLLSTRLRYWSSALSELVRRIEQDRAVLDEVFGVRGGVTGLVFPAGDEHRAGRATTLVRFEHGGVVVYKPRQLALARQLERIVGELSTHHPVMSVHFPPVVERGSYGWAAYAHPADEPEADLPAHYRRLGQAAAFVWVLAGRDIHLENLVLAPDALYVVDEEVFGSGIMSDGAALPEPLREELRFFELSPVYTGLLPYKRPAPGHSERVDRTAYGALHAALGGHDAKSFLLGYAEMLKGVSDALARSSSFRLAVLGLAGQAYRLVPLPTAQYTELLENSLRPDLLVSGETRETFLVDGVRAAATFAPWRAELADDEVAELFAGDVPLFHCAVDSRSAYGTSGVPRPALDHSGLDVLRHRLRQLPAETESLRWQATAALECWQHDQVTGSEPEKRNFPGDDSSLLVEAADHLVAEVSALAIETMDGAVAWADIRADPRRRSHVGHCGTSTASGTTGILLGMTLLHAEFGDAVPGPRAVRVRDLLLGPWCREVERLAGTNGMYALGELGMRLPVLAELTRVAADRLPAGVLPHVLDAIRRGVDRLPARPGMDTGPLSLALISSSHALTGTEAGMAAALARRLLRSHGGSGPDAVLAGRLASVATPAERPASDGGTFFPALVHGPFPALAARNFALPGDHHLARTAVDEVRVRGWNLAEGEAGRISVLSVIGQERAAVTAARSLAERVLADRDGRTRRPGLLTGMTGVAHELARLAVGARTASLVIPARLTTRTEHWVC